MFEFLFKYPPTVFRKGDFVFSSGWPVWLLALLVICAGAGLWWHMRQNHGRLEGRRPWAIWGLQFATAALILFLLWQPAIGIRSLRSQQNVVSVLLDTSRSMALGEGGTSRLDQARQALAGGVLEQLQQKFRVRLVQLLGPARPAQRRSTRFRRRATPRASAKRSPGCCANRRRCRWARWSSSATARTTAAASTAS